MAKVLFVDDELDIEFLTKQKFRKQIESGTFELLFAPNGQKALDLVEKEGPIAVVVSDVNMPEMDGLTLLDKLKEISPETKTIVVSAYGDTKTLRSAMNKGAYDFVTKPVDFKDLEEAILRTLTLYKLTSSPLYTYQKSLAANFPQQVSLDHSPLKGDILWDAFSDKSESLILLGISILPSSIPLEIGMGIAHQSAKSRLLENKDFSLEQLQKDISQNNFGLMSDFTVGCYQPDTKVFSYSTLGTFHAHFISANGKKELKPNETILLSTGDIAILEYPPSNSHILLKCLK